MIGRITAPVIAIAVVAAPVDAAAPVAVSVDTSRQGPKISRDIFGQFAEHLGTGIYGGIWVGRNSKIPNVRGIRTDVVQALRALHVPNVRWPGGCFGDNYHWRNGIGPQAKRPATLNPDWGGVIEPNSFGTHEYFDFLDQIGSEAYISENIGSGTVQEAADWFEYMTSDKPTTLAKERAANGHPAPYKVKYLGLGNENWGCGGAMSPDHYVEEMKRYARFTRNYNPAQNGDHAGDNAMKRIAVGWDSGDSDYTEAVMKAWKNKTWSWDIEGLSLHGYTVEEGWPPHKPSIGFGEADYAKTIATTLKMNDWVTKQSAIMDKYDPEKKVALFVDEWGNWWAPNPGSNPGFLQQQNSMLDAVVAALNLNIFIRHADRVRGANIAQMINVLQAMILTDGPKMVLTPTYHVYRMYVPFQDATLIPVSFDEGSYRNGGVSIPRVDAVAARDITGRLWLALTNLDPNEPASMSVVFAGVAPRFAAGQVLTAAAVDSHNTFDRPDAVQPTPYRARIQGDKIILQLPPKSVAVIQVN
nr:alpha-N-arabinofuranosidase [Sphingomonas sp.]